jgi:ceramide glucosyltransferase
MKLMDPVGAISLIGAAWWCAAVLIFLGSSFAALLARSRPPARPAGDLPPLSVIVPVSQDSQELEGAFGSLLSQNYPDFELIVSSTQDPSPAVEQARAIAARYPAIPARFITQNPHAARNPKINNLALPLAAARHDLVVVKDANIRLPAGRLAEMASAYRGDTGLVASVPLGISPGNFTASYECAAMNGYVARFLLAASAFGMGFGIGATMLFSWRDFERAGGIAKSADAVGEDHAISKMLAAIGRKTKIAGTVEQIIGKRSWQDVWRRQLRWALCRRHEAPFVFLIELCVSPLIAAFAGAAGASTIGYSATCVFLATLVLWITVGAGVALIKGWPYSWRSPFADLLWIACFPLIWIQACFTREIAWGGVSFRLPASRADR